MNKLIQQQLNFKNPTNMKYRYEVVALTKIKTNDLNIKYFSDPEKDSLREHSKTNGSTFDQLVASIKACGGIHTPILLSQDYKILSGHRRFLAYSELGYPHIPCVILNNKISPELEEFILIDANVQGRTDHTGFAMLKKVRLELYFKIIPGLEARFLSNENAPTAKELSEKTGISLKTAEQDKRSIVKIMNKKRNSIKYAKDGINESTLISVSSNLTRVLSAYEAANSKTREKILAKVNKLNKDLYRIK